MGSGLTNHDRELLYERLRNNLVLAEAGPGRPGGPGGRKNAPRLLKLLGQEEARRPLSFFFFPAPSPAHQRAAPAPTRSRNNLLNCIVVTQVPDYWVRDLSQSVVLTVKGEARAVRSMATATKYTLVRARGWAALQRGKGELLFFYTLI